MDDTNESAKSSEKYPPRVYADLNKTVEATCFSFKEEPLIKRRKVRRNIVSTNKSNMGQRFPVRGGRGTDMPMFKQLF